MLPHRVLSTLCEGVVVGHVGPSIEHRETDGVPFLMGKNVGEGFLKLDDLERVSRVFHRTQEKSQLRPGDIVVVRIGESGQASKIPDSLGEANCSGLVVIKGPRDVLADYLVHFLNSPVGRRQSLAETKGSTRQTLNTRSIAAAMIPVPSIGKQHQIVDLLNRTQQLRAKRHAALARLDTLAQAMFIDLFGDPATNPKKWDEVPLGELVTEFRYGTSNRSQPHGKPALRIPNVVGGIIDLTDLKLVPVDAEEFKRLRLCDGDILFVRTNGNPDYVGRCATFDRSKAAASGFSGSDFIFASYLIRARLGAGQVTPTFVREFLLGTEGRRQLRSCAKTSAGQFNINTENLGAIRVPLPPLSLQYRFAGVVAAVEKLKVAHCASLAKMDALFVSLQHRAFRGEL